MRNLNGKLKIIILVAGFAVFLVLMFLFGYGIMGGKNEVLADSYTQRRIELEVLQREQKNFEEGKKELAKLEQAVYPPDELFSRDTKVVKEIKQLEEAAKLYELQMKISISGTTKSATKVPTSSGELFAIPYTITLKGAFANTLLFMQAMEKMPFVTHAKQVDVSVGAENISTTVIASEFYIKMQ